MSPISDRDRFEYDCYSQLRELTEHAAWRILDAAQQLHSGDLDDRGLLGNMMRWITDARFRAARREVALIRDSLGTRPADIAQQLGGRDDDMVDHLQTMLSSFWDLRRASLAPLTNNPMLADQRPVGSPQAAVGNYELFEIIGEGAMGQVFRAWQNPPGRIVALKLIRRDRHVSDVAQRQFEREAAKAGQLDYPGLVPVLDAGTTDQFNFYAMPLVRGKTLRTHLEENGVFAEHDAARIVRSVATAMDYAHEQGVIHCDLKPDNIMLDESDPRRDGIGLPRVTDFGVARSLASADDGVLLGGTPAYMPPELPSIRQDGRGDIYALGVILLELVNGENPFLGLDGDEMLLVKRGGPDAIERFMDSEASPDLLAIIGKCLQSNPRQRYARASSLADDLDRFLHGRPITARVISKVERLSKWARRSPWQAAAVSLLITVALVTGSLATWLRALNEDLTKNEIDLRQSNEMLEESNEDLIKQREATRRLEKQAARREQEQNQTIIGGLVRDSLSETVGPEEALRVNFAVATALNLEPNEQLQRVHRTRLATQMKSVPVAALESVWNGDSVEDAMLSPQRTQLALRRAKSISVLDAELGSEIHRFDLRAHINCMAYSDDGRLIATGADDGTARVWSLEFDRMSIPPLRHQGDVEFLAYGPKGEYLVTISDVEDVSEIRVWRLETQALAAKSLRLDFEVAQLAVSPTMSLMSDGKWGLKFATASESEVIVWQAALSIDPLSIEVSRVRELARWEFDRGTLLEFNEDASWLLAASDDPLDGVPEIHSTETGELVGELSFASRRVTFARYLTDRYVATAEQDSVIVWKQSTDAGTIQWTRQFVLEHEAPIVGMDYHPMSRFLATVTSKGRGRIWDTQTGDLCATPTEGVIPAHKAFLLADGHRMLTIASDEYQQPRDTPKTTAQIHRIDVDDLTSRQHFDLDGGASLVKLNEMVLGVNIAVEKLADERTHSRISLIDFSDESEVGSLTVDGLHNWPIAQHDRLLLTTYKHSSDTDPSLLTVVVWNPKDDSTLELEIEATAHGFQNSRVCLSPDRRWLAVSFADQRKNFVGIWSLPDLKPVLLPEACGVYVREIAFSTTSRRLVAIAETVYESKGIIRSWEHSDLNEWRVDTDDVNFEGQTTVSALSSTAQYASVGFADGTVKIWDLTNGAPHDPPPHADWVSSVAFSRGDGLFASTGDDGRIKSWDIAERAERKLDIPINGPVRWTTFVDGGHLAVVVEQETSQQLRVFDLSTGASIARNYSANIGVMPAGEDVLAVATNPFWTIGAFAGEICVWDAAAVGSRPQIVTMPQRTHSQIYSKVVPVPGSTRLVIATKGLAKGQGFLRVADAETGNLVSRELVMTGPSYDVKFNDRGHLVAIGPRTPPSSRFQLRPNDEVVEWDLTSGTRVRSIELRRVPIDNFPSGVISPNGRFIAASFRHEDANSLFVWDLDSDDPGEPKIVREGQHEYPRIISSGVTGIAWSGDSQRLCWTSSRGLRIYQLPQMEPSGEFLLFDDRLDASLEVQLDERGSRVLVTFHESDVRKAHVGMFDTRNNAELHRFEHRGHINHATFDGSNRLVVIACDDAAVTVWMAGTGEQKWRLEHLNPVKTARVSADGRFLLSATERQCYLWSLVDGRPLRTPTPSLEPLDQVGFFAASGRFFVLPEGGPVGSHEIDSTRIAPASLSSVAAVHGGYISASQGPILHEDARSVRGLWEELMRDDDLTPHFRSSREERIRWHFREAAVSEKLNNWITATWHLDRAIELKGEDAHWSDYARRGRARLQLADDEGSQADFDAAVDRGATMDAVQ